jgi:HEAT repeat protein
MTSRATDAVAELRKALTSDDPVVVDEALLLIGKRELRELEPEVWKFLDSEDSDLRMRATWTLGGNLRVPEFRDRALIMLKADPDPFVRSSAVAAWVGYYAASNDRQVVSTLSDIVRNEKEAAVVRARALRGLYVVTGTPHLHINFSALMDADDPDKLKQMIPWHEVYAMVEGSPGRRT